MARDSKNQIPQKSQEVLF